MVAAAFVLALRHGLPPTMEVMQMQLPGILPLAFFLFLVPAVIPIIEHFWPTNTVWWSALVIAILGAAVSAIWLIFHDKLSSAGMSPPTPAGAPAPVDGDKYTYDASTPRKPSKVRRWLLG